MGNPGLSDASKHSGFVGAENMQLHPARLHGNTPKHRGSSLIKWLGKAGSFDCISEGLRSRSLGLDFSTSLSKMVSHPGSIATTFTTTLSGVCSEPRGLGVKLGYHSH